MYLVRILKLLPVSDAVFGRPHIKIFFKAFGTGQSAVGELEKKTFGMNFKCYEKEFNYSQTLVLCKLKSVQNKPIAISRFSYVINKFSRFSHS